MSRNEFLAACIAATVDPELALEDDDILSALATRDDDAVMRLLDEKF